MQRRSIWVSPRSVPPIGISRSAALAPDQINDVLTGGLGDLCFKSRQFASKRLILDRQQLAPLALADDRDNSVPSRDFQWRLELNSLAMQDLKESNGDLSSFR